MEDEKAKKTTVRFFASLREAAGKDCVEVEHAAGETVGGVVRKAVDDNPDLRELVIDGDDGFRGHLNFTADGEGVEPDDKVGESDEVAVFPPVSGG